MRSLTLSKMHIHFFYIFMMYIFLFQPPFFNKIYFLTTEILIFSFFLLLKPKPLIKAIYKFRVELLLAIIIVLFSAIRDMFSGEVIYSDRFLVFFFQSLIFPILIVYLANKRNINIINLAYWASFIAAVFTLILMSFPSIDDYYKSIQVDAVFDAYERYETRHRAYGIAENLSFTYGYVMGFFAGYSLVLIKRNFFFVVPMIFFLLAVAFNARIGFVIFFIFFIHFFYQFIRIDKKLFINISASLIILYFSLSLFSDFINERTSWASDFFTEIYETFILGQQSQTFETITGRFIILPETASQLIFGRGESLYLKEGMNSDIGFILQLNYAGIFFILAIILFMAYTFVKLNKNIGLSHWFFIAFTASIVILNIKGFAFAATPGARLFYLLYIYFIFVNTRITNLHKGIRHV